MVVRGGFYGVILEVELMEMLWMDKGSKQVVLR